MILRSIRIAIQGVALGGLLLAGGCSEELAPRVNQLDATPTCGILDNGEMAVQFFATVTGGNVLGDPTGANSPLKIRWDFGDGGTAADQPNPTHFYTAAGEYTIRVTVEDDDGQSDFQEMNVIVGEAYGDLDVLSVSINSVSEPIEVRNEFDALIGYQYDFQGAISSSCAINGFFNSYTWEWDFGDDTTITHLADPSHVYGAASGISYDVSLTVTDAATGVSRQEIVNIVTP